MPRSAMCHSGLNRSLISKLFHPVASQNNCNHGKGWNSREIGRNERTQKNKKKYPLPFIGCNRRKMDRAPLCTCEPHAQILGGSKKYSRRLQQRDGKEFDSLYFTTWNDCTHLWFEGKQENKRSTISRPDTKTKYALLWKVTTNGVPWE